MSWEYRVLNVGNTAQLEGALNQQASHPDDEVVSISRLSPVDAILVVLRRRTEATPRQVLGRIAREWT